MRQTLTCKKCNQSHGMYLENMETGEAIPMDHCRTCLFEPQFNPLSHITLESVEEEIQKLLKGFKKDG